MGCVCRLNDWLRSRRNRSQRVKVKPINHLLLFLMIKWRDLLPFVLIQLSLLCQQDMDPKFVARILLYFILIYSRLKIGKLLMLSVEITESNISIFHLLVLSVRCYTCEFNRNACPNLGGCPQNRDRCSVRRWYYNRWITPVVDCPGKFLLPQHCCHSSLQHFRPQSYVISQRVARHSWLQTQ